MKYLSGKNLGADVRDLEPTHIMVAYLGIDWKIFISDPLKIKRIIIQPNPPTNPIAVRDLVTQIGWDCVQFQDNLHAKIYLHVNEDNSGKAIVGSPNLTNHALGGSGLHEAAVSFDFGSPKSDGELDILNKFDLAWKDSVNQYANESEKENRLKKLAEEFELHKEYLIGVGDQNREIRNICSYGAIWRKDFWPIWWHESRDVEYTEEARRADQENGINDWMCVSNDDDLSDVDKFGYWVLCWRITSRNIPATRGSPTWLYVHEAIFNGLYNDELPYTTILAEYESLPKPPPPFSLEDARTKDAIRQVLGDPKYRVFWEEPNDESGWKTQGIDEKTMNDWLTDVLTILKCH